MVVHAYIKDTPRVSEKLKIDVFLGKDNKKPHHIGWDFLFFDVFCLFFTSLCWHSCGGESRHASLGWSDVHQRRPTTPWSGACTAHSALSKFGHIRRSGRQYASRESWARQQWTWRMVVCPALLEPVTSFNFFLDLTIMGWVP
jgi:hypothetical protein